MCKWTKSWPHWCWINRPHVVQGELWTSEDYIKITGTDVFPLPFCGHRWLEDKKVAERALQIWCYIITYVTVTMKKPKSKIPASSSLITLRSAVQDGLIIAKLEYFVSTVEIIKSYLQVFPADVPLLAFISSEIQVLFGDIDEEVCKEWRSFKLQILLWKLTSWMC